MNDTNAVRNNVHIPKRLSKSFINSPKIDKPTLNISSKGAVINNTFNISGIGGK